MTDEASNQDSSAPYQPDEMKAQSDLKIGRNVTLQAGARWTPAGVVTARINTPPVLLVSACAPAIGFVESVSLRKGPGQPRVPQF